MTRACLIAGLAVIALLAHYPGPQHSLAALAILLGLRSIAQRADRQADQADLAQAAADGGPVAPLPRTEGTSD